MRFRHTAGKMSGGIRLSGGFYNTTIVRFKAVRFAAKNSRTTMYDFLATLKALRLSADINF